ncbi:MAG: pyridine nucleotide-disulfide oxidoreductase, partial [Clostridia bacterium]|nr:pyridine nucleotide-disulfide oxidoreductase [Clostridia bacterium]
MANSIFIAGSTFDDKGGWISDPQFMEQMGSSYLIAHGIGTPVADASTAFRVAQDGQYNLYVRTRNWTSRWSDKPTPGIFTVSIDGEKVGGTFGNGSSQWAWQGGGKVSLKKGEHRITLHDETGFDGRCDAILLTTDEAAPSDAKEDFMALRHELLAIPAPEDKGS